MPSSFSPTLAVRAPAGGSSFKGEKDTSTNEGGESECLPFVIGSCPDMCPVRERAARERLRDLAVFERLHGNPQKTSSSLAVKKITHVKPSVLMSKWGRTISGGNAHASDIRPLPVLRDTLTHLLCLLESSDHSFEVIHDFVFDRTRSIRQDLSMQRINNCEAIDMYEQMVEFHIISHNKLLWFEKKDNISSMRYLNLEQLKKTLKTLYDLYDINRSRDFVSKREAEFYSFYVLLHLDSNDKSMSESLATWFWRLNPCLLKSKDLSFARNTLRHYRMNNFKRFFNSLAKQASYLQFCLLEPLFNEVRSQALCCINHGGYKLHPFPLSYLAKILMMMEPDVESLCTLCGLEVTADEAGNKFLPAKQNTFSLPKGSFPMYKFKRPLQSPLI